MYTVKTTDFFERAVKKLSKKYRNIKKDFLPILKQLQAGEFAGNAISGFDSEVYKLRVPSSDQKKGKSGGFRLIYYIVLDDSEVVLLTVYAKSEKTNIKENEIRRIIEKFYLE